MGLNKVMLIGITRDKPVVRFGEGNASRAELALWVEKSYLTPTGEEKTTTTRVEVVAFGPLAEHCAAIQTESEVQVEGRLRQDSVKGPDGKPATRYVVVAERCEFAGAPPGPLWQRPPRIEARAPAREGMAMAAGA